MPRLLYRILLAAFMISTTALSQQYYALLISGDGIDPASLQKPGSELTGGEKDDIAVWARMKPGGTPSGESARRLEPRMHTDGGRR